MNKTSQVSKPGAGNEGRRRLLIGTLIGLALLALSVVLLLKPAAPSQSATPASASGTTPNASVSQSTAQVAISTNAAAPVAAGTQTSISDLLKKLTDPSLPLAERQKVIKALAQNGSPQAIAALKDALSSGSEEMRKAVAEELGQCSGPDCAALLLGLLNDPSEAVVKAAIKGLAQQGSPQAVDALDKLSYDQARSLDVRVASIDGLGAITDPAAFQALSRAATTFTDEDMIKAALSALGTRDFDQTQGFFQNYLANPTVSSELRVAAAEALAQAQGDPTPFLATLAVDSDSNVRASAAWAMSDTETSGNIGAQLLAMAQVETDPDVRLRLYQAIANQANLDPSAVLAAVSNEKDPAASVTALDLLAKTFRDNPTPELQSFFDQTAVPALKNIALNADTSDERMGAIIALVRANDSSAFPVMQDIAQQAKDPRVAQAASKFVNTFAAANGMAPSGK